MIYDLDQVPDRRPTDSVKWNHFEADVLPLWVADMDFPVAEPVREALRRRIEHGVFGYPDVFSKRTALTELQQVLCDRLDRLYHWKVSPDELLFLPGVIVGLNLTCQALAEPGGSVLVQTPVYPPFLETPLNASQQRHDALLARQSNGYYEIDWEAFEAGITGLTRVFILCNPHNPVGRVFRKDELERMARICLRHGVTICADEIHCDLVFSGNKHIPIAALDEEIAQHTITLMAPTKTFNLAGLQCSFAIVQNKELRKKLEESAKGLVMWPNLLGLTATLAAYRDGQDWLSQVLAYMEANRDYLTDYVAKILPQLKMMPPEGTYLAWIDCHNSGIQGNPCEYFVKQARVGLNDGVSFGNGGEGFVRLNFACTRAVLTQALEQMKTSLEKL